MIFSGIPLVHIFSDMVGNLFQFDKHGDGPAYYRVMQYKRTSGTNKYDYEEVGNWKAGLLIMNEKESIWKDIPVSRCSLDCQAGFRKEYLKGDTCCWSCLPCQEYQYNSDELTCSDCQEGEWPTDDRLDCNPLPVVHMEWMSPFSIVPCSIAAVGLVMLLVITISFICYRRTPLIKVYDYCNLLYQWFSTP